MHTPCTLFVFNFDYTLQGAKQLVERVIPKNKTMLTLSTINRLQRLRSALRDSHPQVHLLWVL